MKIKVDVLVHGARPAAGSLISVQLRDTSHADAPAVILHEVRTKVASGTGPVVASVAFDTGAALPEGTTAWARIAASGDMQRTQAGDFITMAAYPVDAAPSGTLSLELKKV